MRLVELKELKRKDTPLHYIREFSGIAVFEQCGRRVEKALVFTVERKPVGAPDIAASFLEEPEWPLLPLLSSVKSLVLDLDKNGGLP